MKNSRANQLDILSTSTNNSCGERLEASRTNARKGQTQRVCQIWHNVWLLRISDGGTQPEVSPSTECDWSFVVDSIRCGRCSTMNYADLPRSLDQCHEDKIRLFYHHGGSLREQPRTKLQAHERTTIIKRHLLVCGWGLHV